MPTDQPATAASDDPRRGFPVVSEWAEFRGHRTEPASVAALRALVEAIAPLMDRDYCQPFTSAWELDPHGGPENRDGEVIYEQVRAAWERAKEAADGE